MAAVRTRTSQLNADGEHASVLELCVDGSDEDGALEKAGDDGAGDEQEHGSYSVGDIGEDVDGDLRITWIGGVEC